MAKRDSFLLRIDPRVLNAVRKWSDDEMRSVNAQIEYLLQNALKAAGRLERQQPAGPSGHSEKSTDGDE